MRRSGLVDQAVLCHAVARVRAEGSLQRGRAGGFRQDELRRESICATRDMTVKQVNAKTDLLLGMAC